MKYNLKGFFVTIFAIGMLSSCESLDDSITNDPYGGGKEPLGVKFLLESPVPASGYPGDEVKFKAKGLSPYIMPDGEYKFKFFLSDTELDVKNATDSTITVVLPQAISSGQAYLVLENQVFYGPNFTVLGNVSVDKNHAFYDNNLIGDIYECVEDINASKRYCFYLGGQFSQRVGNDTRNAITHFDNMGNVSKCRTERFWFWWGLYNQRAVAQPTIRSMSYFDDGRMLIAGEFDMIESPAKGNLPISGRTYLNNMAILKKSLEPDTVWRDFSENMKTDGTIEPNAVHSLNGGTDGEVLKGIVTKAQNIVAIGNFSNHVRFSYGISFYETDEELTPVASAFRMNDEGEIDLTYRPVAQGYSGAQGGSVSDAAAIDDDGIVICGSFTSFDGVPAPGIVKLTPEGDVDLTFMNNIGTGPNSTVSMVRYNKTIHKIMVTGVFREFDGKPMNYIAMLNDDGTMDDEFVPRKFGGGYPTFVGLLDSDKIVVAGGFTEYDGVKRPGFLILDHDGQAIQHFNVPGQFEGQIYTAHDAETSIGGYGILLTGNIMRFNGESCKNVVMLAVDLTE